MLQQEKEMRAFYTVDFVRVYQAYNKNIADSAIKNKRFISPPFKMERTTWIKPSFLWMMYRSGWASKENQERILAIDIKHNSLQTALDQASLSHFDKTIYFNEEEWQKQKALSKIIVQWDPERDVFLNKLNYRSIQIGITPAVVKSYITDWIIKITDITEDVKNIKLLLDNKKVEEAKDLLPLETKYPLPQNFQSKIFLVNKL